MLGVYDGGKLRYVGHTGTGFSEEMLKDILKRLTPYFTDTCPFDPRPKANAQVQWVKPKLVCEVAFQEWTSDGKLRAPAFLGLREDKAPTEVVREVAIDPHFAPNAFRLNLFQNRPGSRQRTMVR